MAKISEVMRLGIALSGQTKHTYIQRDSEDKLLTCAVGSLALGAYGEFKYLSPLEDQMYVDFPHLLDVIETPLADMFRDTVEGYMICLNDNEGWTREQIADWLESLGL